VVQNPKSSVAARATDSIVIAGRAAPQSRATFSLIMGLAGGTVVGIVACQQRCSLKIDFYSGRVPTCRAREGEGHADEDEMGRVVAVGGRSERVGRLAPGDGVEEEGEIGNNRGKEQGGYDGQGEEHEGGRCRL